MSSIDCSESSYVAIKACSVSAARARNIVQLLVIVFGAASLAACTQSTVVQNSRFVSPSRQASLPHDRTASFVTNRHVASVRKHTPLARHHHATPTQVASHGIASFYSDEQKTANGEKFDPNAMTAAHRSLPFGTKLRVTNLATGRSVTVRVNDRGPYIAGRVVDVSYSAAESLGIVGRGIAKVKLDVVH